MPELPEIRALAERISAAFAGRQLASIDVFGFSSLKTVTPRPDELGGKHLTGVTQRGKYLIFLFDGGESLVVHLGQAGRLDLEERAKSTKSPGGVVRLRFADGSAIFVREFGSQRKAGAWVLAAGDLGPLVTLGPEATEDGAAELLRESADNRHLHTLLRNQHVVAGIGRGLADDILNQAQLSPFASLRALDAEQHQRLVSAISSVITAALGRERDRTGGLSDAKLGDRFLVHNRAGQPCPRCHEPLLRVSYDSHEVVYCKRCQTGGRTLADRRLSRLLR